MEIKTTKTEYKELLSVLEKAANYIDANAKKAKEFDLCRRISRARLLLKKRNGEA